VADCALDQNLGSLSRELVREARRSAKEIAPCSPPPWDADSVCVPATVVLNGRSAIGVAATVLRNKGVTDIRIVSDAAIGWVGKEWAFRVALQSAKQSYEVGIATRMASDGLTEFLCCARPQLAMAMVGTTRLNELATMFATEIAGTVTSDPES
jgi:hypothetical protein